MKRFKKIDYLVSCFLIISFTVVAIAQPGPSMFTGYFIVGGWQLTSMVVHACNGWFVRKEGLRFFYHCVVAFTICSALICSAGLENTIIVFYFLLFITPVMAVFYTVICIREVHLKMRRPLDILK